MLLFKSKTTNLEQNHHSCSKITSNRENYATKQILNSSLMTSRHSADRVEGWSFLKYDVGVQNEARVMHLAYGPV